MKKVLLTRPSSASQRWAILLARHGFDCFVEPLLKIEPTHAPRPRGDFQAVVITSANAPEAIDVLGGDIKDLLALPCYCVGASTSEAAKSLGFTDIKCGQSDSSALAQEIVQALTYTERPLLHIAGDVVDEKASKILAQKGLTLTPWTVYRASALEDLTPSLRTAFKAGAINAVPVFSPRSAHILVSLIQKHHLTQACHHVNAIALSPAVAAVLQTLPWRQLRVASSPSEEDVLACLQKELSMTISEPPRVEASLPSKAKSRVKPFVRKALTIAVIVGIVSVAFVECPWFFPVASQPHTNISADPLERRVEALENRVKILTEIPSASSVHESNSDQNTTNLISSLQTQISELQDKDKAGHDPVRKMGAIAFTFLDIREATQNGRPFAKAFERLQLLTADDPSLSPEASKLLPFASEAVPTLNQLRTELTGLEASVPVDMPYEDGPQWQKNLRAVFGKFVSVHPLHNPEFTELEQSLENNDAATAGDAFKFLSPVAQKKLAPWQAKLSKRIALDEALEEFATAFSAPAQKEGNP